MSIPELTPEELERRLAEEDPPMLLDVREHFEREIADLPDVGQLRIPLGELYERLEEVDPAREVVVYCRTGARSGWAVGLMQGHGYERVWNLQGGVLGWREAIDPSLQAY